MLIMLLLFDFSDKSTRCKGVGLRLVHPVSLQWLNCAPPDCWALVRQVGRREPPGWLISERLAASSVATLHSMELHLNLTGT